MWATGAVTRIIKYRVLLKLSGVEPCPPPWVPMASETTVKESQTAGSNVDKTNQDRDGREPRSNAFAGRFASSALRIGLVLVGLFLLLAALGQLSGIDMLGLTADLLGSEVGRWLFVAVVAIALIAVAVHGFTGRSD